MSANLGVTFSYTNYQDGTLKVAGKKKVDSTNLFTFNTVWADFTYSNISKVLKSVEFLYQMEVNYYDAYYGGANGIKFEETWNVHAVPADKQKLDEIKKQKPEEAKKVQNKNLERAKKLGRTS